MHKLRLAVLDNNPFNDPKYVKQRLKDDGILIKSFRDIVDEEDYLEMKPSLEHMQSIIEKDIREKNLDIDLSEIDFIS